MTNTHGGMSVRAVGTQVHGTYPTGWSCRHVAHTRSARYSIVVTTNIATQLVFEIRSVSAADWELARCVRLAALADAPDAFAATLAEELAFPDAAWRERAAKNAEGTSSCGFLALREGVPCGMAVGVLEAGGQRVELNAVWVAPNVRRLGLAGRLVNAVCSWARQRHARDVELEVTSESRAAIALYHSLGFAQQDGQTHCGSRQALAIRMGKSLPAG